MEASNKPKLIILSDFWRNQKAEWISNYTSVLDHYFDLTFYNCADLAGITLIDVQHEKIHQQFVDGGIDRAVKNLLKRETEKINILAFSLGGTIAWKAALLGLKVENLFAISSTRLRYEFEKPAIKMELLFGDDDSFKPDAEWFEKMALRPNFITNQDHEMYKEKEIAHEICSIIINKIVPSL